MNRQHYPLILICAVVVLVSLCYCPIFDLFQDDKEVFKYGGLLLNKGGVLYRDLFDHKPPLIFFLNYAGLLIGSWGLWFIDLGLTLWATLTFYTTCREYRLPYPWLLPVLFNLMLRDFLLGCGIGMTREFTCLFILLFFSRLLGKYRHRYLMMGVFTGLTCFMQQEQVLVLAPFMVYAVLCADAVPVRLRAGWMALGFLTVAAPILLYLSIRHALGYFWEDTLRFNFSWYATATKSVGDHFRTAKRVLDAANYEIPFLIAVTLGIVALFLPNKRKGLLYAALAGTVFSFSAEFLGARAGEIDFFYYFVPVSVAVCMLLFVVLAFTKDQLIAGKRACAGYAFLLLCSMGYTALQHGAHLRYFNQNAVVRSPELNYLRAQHLEDYQLYVMGNTAYLYAYNKFRILSPSPWIYQHFWKWYPRWDPDGTLIRSIGRELLVHKTTYVIMDTVRGGWFINQQSSKWWLSFMDQHYQPLTLPGAERPLLWKLKDTVPAVITR